MLNIYYYIFSSNINKLIITYSALMYFFFQVQLVMASNENNESTLSSKDSESTKAKRGKVCLHRLAKRRNKGIIEDVEFNQHGQPVGKIASEMQSYIGLLARDHVHVNIKSWREVSKDVKEHIWASVKVSVLSV